MRLLLAQSVSYSDSRRPYVPSDHNTRWRLLNINHNFMIKSKNPSKHTTPLIRRHDKSLRHRQTTSRRLARPAASITVSAAFIKCSSVYQPLTSVDLLYYHRSFFVRKTKTKIKIRLSVINVCSHR
jgi:hypothetical protein